ncbi:acyl-CoA dehydrogenase family protein [Kitasatospora sp. NPDC056138]|uniref:acyl-CoA dehydrogenase family protein n=1 Tax=Kitasatospora sp. NPDC056138 TaxID=3345724 RepID=UPI0035E12BAF
MLSELIADVVKPTAASVDSNGAFPSESINALKEAGFLALTIPEDLGGIGATAAEFSDVVLELAQACASTAMVYLMHATSVGSLVLLADREQQKRYLQPVLDGRWLVTEAISEAGSGSQWWSVSSTATPVEAGYRLEADKSFATSAGHADLYIISTQAPDSGSSRDHALFAVPEDTAGLRSGEWKGLGLTGNSSTWLSFHGTVPQEALLAGSGGGDGLRRYNEVNQPLYHLGFGAAYLGIASAAFEACVERIRSRQYVSSTTTFGTGLSQYPVARRHVGQMAIRLAAVRGMVRELSSLIDNGRPLEEQAIPMTALKVAAAEAAVDVAREAMMASGGSSYAKGFLTIERHIRDALAGSLMGPNDDFCKELIGRLILGGGSYHDL